MTRVDHVLKGDSKGKRCARGSGCSKEARPDRRPDLSSCVRR